MVGPGREGRAPPLSDSPRGLCVVVGATAYLSQRTVLQMKRFDMVSLKR